MPLILAPYTLGTQLGVAAATPTGGAAYYGRRKRFLMYLLASVGFLLVLPL